MIIRFTILTLLFLSPCIKSVAQFRLPTFDLSVKGGYFVTADNIITYAGTNGSQIRYKYQSAVFTGELNVHINQYISAGAFWTKSIGGTVEIDMEGNGNNFGLGDKEGAHQMYGALIRLSTGRKPGFRPYLQAMYFKSEMYFDMGDYRVANESNGFGVGIGAMIKVSDKLYINVPDIGLRLMTDDFFFDDEGQGAKLEFRAGLTYNFTKRK